MKSLSKHITNSGPNHGTVVSYKQFDTPMTNIQYNEYTKELFKLLASVLKKSFGDEYLVSVNSSSRNPANSRRGYTDMDGNHEEGIEYLVVSKTTGSRIGYNGSLRTSKNGKWMFKFSANSSPSDLAGTGYLSGNHKMTDNSTTGGYELMSNTIPSEISKFVSKFSKTIK